MTTREVINMCEDNGVELLVGYYASNDLMDDGVFVELESVEVVIAGKGIDIRSQLTKSQVNYLEQRVADQIEWAC